MIEAQKQRLIEIFKKAGYKTQADVARAMEEGGIYEKKGNLRVYINQVLNGHRSASEKLAKGLAKICEDDMVLAILDHSTLPQTKLEYGLELKIGELYNALRLTFNKSDWRSKMKMCLDFEKYVRGYESEPPQNVNTT